MLSSHQELKTYWQIRQKSLSDFMELPFICEKTDNNQ